MKNLIEKFPDNLIEAVLIAKNTKLKNKYPKFNNILICGMGGSGIGGRLVANWFQNELQIPIICNQDYTIPNYVNNTTLIVASSYSGETEETLSAVEEACNKGAYIVAICSGGKLSDFCNSKNLDCILIPGGNPPRTQLAFSLVQITNILISLSLIDKQNINFFTSTSELLKTNSAYIISQAKEMAGFINNKNLIIYSETKDEAIAIRARQQFNENSKLLCSHHVVPEMNHNELVGWEGAKQNNAVIILHTGDFHPQNKKRFDFITEVFETKTKHIFKLEAKGNSVIEESLFLINIIDWASYFLALENNIDPIDISVLNSIKKYLTK